MISMGIQGCITSITSAFGHHQPVNEEWQLGRRRLTVRTSCERGLRSETLTAHSALLCTIYLLQPQPQLGFLLTYTARLMLRTASCFEMPSIQTWTLPLLLSSGPTDAVEIKIMHSTLSWDMIPAARNRGNRDDSERSDASLLPGAHMGLPGRWPLAVRVSQEETWQALGPWQWEPGIFRSPGPSSNRRQLRVRSSR